MRRGNSLEIINTKFILSNNQQTYYRDRLSHLLDKEGVISICLDSKSLFIEYSEEIIDKSLIRSLLLDINFPMKELSNKSKKQRTLKENHLIS